MSLSAIVRRAPVAVVALAVAAGLCATGLVACADPAASPSPTASSGEVLVRVEGTGVTRADVEGIRAEARLGGRSDAGDAAQTEAVRRVLVRREAARLGVTVGDTALDRRLASLEVDAGGTAALDAALENATMTRAQLRDAVRYSLLARALADVKYADVVARPAAVRAFYDRRRDELFTTQAAFKLGKITVPGERLANTLVRRLRRGADFTALARRYSMDPETRFQGGLVGWVSGFTVPPEVQDVVAGVEPGGVADPVRSSGKWQVFKVFDTRPARVVPFWEARDDIQKELTRRRRAAALEAWVDRQVASAEVVEEP